MIQDNDINRTILAKRLTTDGYNVATTTNGQEGLDKVIADRSFDVVLMDLQCVLLLLSLFFADRPVGCLY